MLPGPGLALSVHQDTGWSTGGPWRTERASGARWCPDDGEPNEVRRTSDDDRRESSGTSTRAVRARAASRGAPSAARAFEGRTSSQQSLSRTVLYAPCTDRFSIAEYKVCEPLYDALVHSYSNHYETTSEAPSRSAALTRCLRQSATSRMTNDGSRSRLSNHGPRTSSRGFLAWLRRADCRHRRHPIPWWLRRRASGPRDRRSLAAADCAGHRRLSEHWPLPETGLLCRPGAKPRAWIST